jgi:hypothetical protein
MATAAAVTLVMAGKQIGLGCMTSLTVCDISVHLAFRQQLSRSRYPGLGRTNRGGRSCLVVGHVAWGQPSSQARWCATSRWHSSDDSGAGAAARTRNQVVSLWWPPLVGRSANIGNWPEEKELSRWLLTIAFESWG